MMIRIAVLATVVMGCVAMAEAQQAPGLQVYLDLDSAREQVTPGSANQQAQAAFTPLQARITSLQAAIQTKTTDLQRNMPIWPEPQVTKAQRDVEDLQNELLRARANLDNAVSDARFEMTSQANLKIGRAMRDYVAQNRLGVVIEHRSGASEEGVIVLNPQFEIATGISEMVKSGPGAFAPAHPKRAPVVKYADLSRLIQSAASYADAMGAIQQVTDAADIKLRGNDSDATRWQNLARFGNAVEQAEANLRLQLLELQKEKLRRDRAAEANALRERYVGFARQEIVEVIARNPDAFGADVLKLEDSFDDMTIADPSLDVTTTLSNLMKPRP